MRTHELMERRDKLIRECRSLVDAANGEDLADEARKKFDANEAEIRKLDEQISREKRLAEMERQSEASETLNNGNSDYDHARREFRLLNAVAHLAGVQGVDAGLELEVSQQAARDAGRSTRGLYVPYEVMRTPRRNIEERVVTAAGGGAGAIWEDHRPELYIDELAAQAVVGQAGAPIITGLVGDFSAPANDQGASAQWVADNASISSGDIDVNKRQMSPKHLGAIIPFSNTVLLQSAPEVETMARRTFAAQFAAAFDSAALIGGGSNEPSGVLDTITPGTFATPTWSEGLELIASLATSNALIDDGSLAWVGHPQTSKKLRATVRVGSTDSRFIQEDPRELYGYRFFNSTALTGLGSPADRGIVFGRWSDCLIGIWRDLEILVNPYGNEFAKGGVEIRGLMSADVVLRHSESFAGANDMNTA